MTFDWMRPFSLYVHIPYCDSKCPYCDFNSYAVKRWPEDEYVAALIGEIEYYAPLAPWNHPPKLFAASMAPRL